MAYAVKPTAKRCIAFITQPDSKTLNLCWLQYQAFLYLSTQ